MREVYLDLAQTRKIAYTTVLTMMGILEQKGHLTKSPGERANVYRAAQPRESVVRNVVNEFIARVFSGSAKPLLVHLVDDTTLDHDELAEIEARVKEKRDKSRPERSAGGKGSRRKAGGAVQMTPESVVDNLLPWVIEISIVSLLGTALPLLCGIRHRARPFLQPPIEAPRSVVAPGGDAAFVSGEPAAKTASAAVAPSADHPVSLPGTAQELAGTDTARDNELPSARA